jgi:hypothetical protein
VHCFRYTSSAHTHTHTHTHTVTHTLHTHTKVKMATTGDLSLGLGAGHHASRAPTPGGGTGTGTIGAGTSISPNKLMQRSSAHSYEVDRLMLSGGQRRRVDRLLREQLLRTAYLSPHKTARIQAMIDEHLMAMEADQEELGGIIHHPYDHYNTGEVPNTTLQQLERKRPKSEQKPRRLSPSQIKAERPHSPSMNHKKIDSPKRSISPSLMSKTTPNLGPPLDSSRPTTGNVKSGQKLVSRTQQLPARPKTSAGHTGTSKHTKPWAADTASSQQQDSQSQSHAHTFNKEILSNHSNSLVRTAAGVWDSLIENLAAAADAIMYRDLVEVSNMREPPATVETVIGYLCVLLGLTPTWAIARRSLFKELVPLQKFLREVDPMSIPLRRVRKAYELKENVLGSVTEEQATNINVSVGKLMK